MELRYLQVKHNKSNKRESKKRGRAMALKNLNSLDSKLKDMYSNQVTTSESAAQPFVDRSEVLFAQMNFIAMANRERLNLL